jgi:hypothetical protein
LTEGRGEGAGKVVCVDEERDRTVFETRLHPIRFADDPLDVVGVTFRVRDCPFPRRGVYSLRFLYNGEVIGDRPLRLR